MLYHFSENPEIKIFAPRPANAYPQLNPVVWAIDREHALHYYFPRECPRVIYWKSNETTKQDKERFFSDSEVDKIIVVENGWLERIRQTRLYIYTFPEEPFQLFEEAKTAGYYIAHETVTPLNVERVDDVIGRLLKENIELRFTPNLHPLCHRVTQSTLDFSIIRFRNAASAKC